MYTVEELGLESGLGYSQVSRIELGKRNPTAYTLYMLSKTLDVCPSEFFKPVEQETVPYSVNNKKAAKQYNNATVTNISFSKDL